MRSPCKNCEERFELLNKGLICHSYCKLYDKFTKAREKDYKARLLKTEYATIKNEGYRRATNNRYEYENKR